ncbi:MAG: polysaccharide deacetylase family protein [Alistipes sp.]|nr:polysaccharide deacetylase family protein [Candidatus Alistipes equi]
MKVRPWKIIRKFYPSCIWRIEDESDSVYLTFDDGPTPGVTEWILSTLKKYNAKATFFVLGKNVELYPDLYSKLLEDGHKIGNHTYSHQKGIKMSLERYLEDVEFANDIVHSNLFRPPYALATPVQIRTLSKYYKIIMWDIVSRDYNRKLSPERCMKGVLPHIAPGSIIAFHDSDKSFRNMSIVLPKVLEKIYSNGWKCRVIE